MIAAIQWPKNLLPDPQRLGEMAISLTLTIALAFVAQRLLFLLWGRLARLTARAAGADHAAAQRAETLKHIARRLTTAVVSVTALIHGLEILGWDVKPFLAGAGILGVALGFGAQTVVRDWIAGVSILLENQYGIGDIIEVNGEPATVERMSMRSTQLRDQRGYLYFVPNGEMRIVTNRTRDWNQLSVDISVLAGEDIDRALELLRGVAAAMGSDPSWENRLLEPVRVWGVERLGAEVLIRMVVRTRPGTDASDAPRELRRRAHQALAAAGIRFPATVVVMTAPAKPTTTS